MSGTGWEKSKALTPLKHDLLTGLFGCSRRFFLTGGTALGVFYLQHRVSYDLDIFVTDDTEWQTVGHDFLLVVERVGATASRLVASPSFVRYDVTRKDEREIVDLVRETVPQIWPDKPCFDGIRVDTLEEMAVNKWCTLLGRAEIKDLIDLYFLSRVCDIWGLFEKAQLKEGGLEPSVLSWILSQITLHELPAHLIAPLSVEEMRAFVSELHKFFDARSFPES